MFGEIGNISRFSKSVIEIDLGNSVGTKEDIEKTINHIGNFCKWKDHDSYQKAFDRLLKDLKAERAMT